MRKGSPRYGPVVKTFTDKIVDEMENTGYAPVRVNVSVAQKRKQRYAAGGRYPAGVDIENHFHYTARDEFSSMGFGGPFIKLHERTNGDCNIEKELGKRKSVIRKILKSYEKEIGDIKIGLNIKAGKLTRKGGMLYYVFEVLKSEELLPGAQMKLPFA